MYLVTELRFYLKSNIVIEILFVNSLCHVLLMLDVFRDVVASLGSSSLVKYSGWTLI